jgi:alkylhydroperoxidase/carboxymuconolactone decarboxylase family protein YurZ
MDSHGAFASELMRRGQVPEIESVVDGIKTGGTAGLSLKMAALVRLARIVQRRSRDVTRRDVEAALTAGATDGDTQLTVLIASAFCMYNRMVDGLRASTPPSDQAYRERAAQIAEHGYSDPRIAAIPR